MIQRAGFGTFVISSTTDSREPEVKGGEVDTIRKEAGLNFFHLTHLEWIADASSGKSKVERAVLIMAPSSFGVLRGSLVMNLVGEFQ